MKEGKSVTVLKQFTLGIGVIGALTVLAWPAAGAQVAGAQAAGAREAGARVAGAQAAAAQAAGARAAREAAAPAADAPGRRAVRRTPRPVLQTRTWHAPGFGYYTPLAYPGYFYGPPWGLHQYGPWGPYPYYGGYYYRERGSVRLQVKPVETEVYVDGYYAGVVDSYDGFFQRLSLPPGQHDIELRLDGYRSIQEQVYLTIGQSYRIEHGMEPLGPGETTPPPPTPRAEPQVEPVLELEPEPFAWPERDRTTLAPATPAGFGDLVVRVQPTGATIYVDGEEWQTPDGSRLELELGAGRHRIEVRRAGYEGYVTDVTVREGETTAVNISLPRNRPEDPEEPEPGPGA